MNTKSAYWLSHTPTEKFNLIELAHTQRAISNFVKITASNSRILQNNKIIVAIIFFTIKASFDNNKFAIS